MGQYYLIANLDRGEYIHPHDFGDGAKLLEFGPASKGTMFGLAILLRDTAARGGGDIDSDDPLVGSWAGDRIVITGDYAKKGKFTGDSRSLNEVCQDDFVDISAAVAAIVRAES